MDFKAFLKKAWKFIWEDDSILSWIVNIILAFVIIKFLVYPGLGLILQTTHPIVAVVSGSMEHKTTNPCIQFNTFSNGCVEYDKELYSICGKNFESNHKVDFEFFWQTCGEWYSSNANLTKEDFSDFDMRNGFNKGDIILLRGSKASEIKPGNVIVYMSKTAKYPIIHRVVSVSENDGSHSFMTKGDHNSASDPIVDESQLIGKSIFRIPLIGWIKIGFVDLINFVRSSI